MANHFSAILLLVMSFGWSVLGFSISLPSPSSSSSTSKLYMATWSDSKAVMQYQDFLASGKQEIELTPDGPSVIIVPKDGQNEISKALKEMGKGDDLVITIDETLPSEMGGKKEYPIYITLPPTDLRDFLKNLRKIA